MSVPALRDRFILSHHALREILSTYLRVLPQELVLDVGAYGKPKLADSSAWLQFNLSHSHDQALIAVSSVEVGVDIERIRELRHFDRFVRRFLSPNEATYLSKCSADVRDGEFFKIWTAKEAYLKAIGTGLAGELQAFEVSVSSESLQLRRGDALCSDCFVSTLAVSPGYAAAVVVRRPTAHIHYFDWSCDV